MGQQQLLLLVLGIVIVGLAVCETLYFTSEIRAMIAKSGEAIDEGAIRKQAEKDGMLSLGDSARELVKMGATTLEEVLRMTSAQDAEDRQRIFPASTTQVFPRVAPQLFPDLQVEAITR